MKRMILKKRTLITVVIMLVLLMLALLVGCDDKTQEQPDVIEVVYHQNDGTDLTHTETVSPDKIGDYVPAERTGYTFLYWALNQSGSIKLTPDIRYSSPLSLYAIWEAHKHKVTFVIEGSGASGTIERTVDYSEAAELPTEEELAEYLPTGYHVARWTDAEGNETEDYLSVTKDMYVYAEIAANGVQLDFYDGETLSFSLNGEYGEDIEADAPKKQGFDFVGWFDQAGEPLPDKFAENGTYFARYKLSAPNIPSVLGGGVETSITYGDALQLSIYRENAPDGVTYNYQWLSGDEVVSNGEELVVTSLAAGQKTYIAKAIASAEGYGSVETTCEVRVTVQKATLNVSLDAVEMEYGSPLPSLAELVYSVSGFKYEESEAVLKLDGATVSSADYAVGSGVGKYEITLSGIEADNYIVPEATAQLEVKQRQATLSVAEQRFTYDGNVKQFKPDLSPEGLLEGQRFELTLTTNSQNAGLYTISDGLTAEYHFFDGEDETTSNYALSLSASVNIEKADFDYALPTDLQLTFDGAEHKPEISADGVTPLYKYGEGDYAPEAPSFKNAGSYTVSFKLEKDNYNTVESEFTLNIAKAEVKVIARPQSTVYCEEFVLNQSAYTVDGELFGEGLTASLSTDYEVGKNATDYVIKVNATSTENIDISAQNGVLTVEKADLTVVFENITLQYGEPLPDRQLYSFADLPATGQVPTVELVTDYAPGKPQGSSFELSANVQDDNYNVTLTKGRVNVTKRKVTIVLSPITVTYGEDIASEAYGFSLVGQTYNGEELKLEYYSGDYKKGSPVSGSYTLRATLSADEVNSNYQATVQTAAITVQKRVVSVKIKDVTVTYGENVEGAFGFDVQGQDFYGEVLPTYSTAYKAGDVKNATVTASFDDPNHEVQVQDGTISVAPRALAITIDALHAYDGQPYMHEFAGADEALRGLYGEDSFSGTLATTKGDVALYTDFATQFVWTAAYAISNKAGEDVKAMYNITYALNVEISEQKIGLRTSGFDAEYDGAEHGASVTVTDPELQKSATIMFADSADGEYTLPQSPKYTAVGTYTVYFKVTAPDKTDTLGSVKINIKKRNATISAADVRITFGDDKPALTINYVNVISKDEAGFEASATCDYAKGNDKGTYSIVVTYTENDNYNITLKNGTLTVAAKPVTVTLTNTTVEYGENFALEYTISDEAAREGLSLNTSYAAGKPVNVYGVTATGTNANYSYSVVGSINVTKRTATVTVTPLTITYGEELALAYTVDRLYGNDKLDVSFSGYENKAGNYTVHADAENDNYRLSFVDGALNIRKKQLSLALTGSMSITYGEEMPSYDVTATSALAFNEKLANVLKGSLSVECEYASNKHAGTFDLTPSGLSADNYELSFAPASLNVAKATLTATPVNVSDLTYGSPVPAFKFEIRGWANGDSADNVALPTITISTDYTPTSNVGGGSNAGKYSCFTQASEEVELDNYVLKMATVYFALNKANHDAEAVKKLLSAYSVTYKKGATVANSVTLPANFSWMNGSTPLSAKTSVYFAKYSKDPTNYNDLENVEVTINVARGTPKIPTPSASNLETDYSGAEIDIVAKIGLSLPSDYDGGQTYTYAVIQGDSLKPTRGGVYKLRVTLPASENWNQATAELTFKIKAAKIDSTTYTIEDALSAATSNQTVTVFGDAFISSNVEIKSGVTLLLPYDKTSGINSTLGGSVGVDAINTPASCKLAVTLNANCVITNNGKLVIGGVTSGNQRYSIGSGGTAGDYAKLTLGAKASIVSNGDVTVYGFIMEEAANNGSSVTMESGILIMPFLVIEHRGGSIFYGMAGSDGKKLKGSPFNRFYLQNVTPTLTIKSSAQLLGHANLYASNQDNTTDIKLVGNSSSHLIQLNSGSYVTQKYNVSNKITQLDVYGDMTLNAMTLKLSISFFTATLSTANVLFPISWYYNISLNPLSADTTATVTANQDIKIMPGGKLTINKGVTVNANQIMVADSSYKTYGVPSGTQYETNKGDGQLVVNGSLNCENIGGKVTSTLSGASLKCTGVSVSTGEVSSSSGSSILTSVTWETNTYTLKNTDGAEMSAGTYTYNGSKWV